MARKQQTGRVKKGKAGSGAARGTKKSRSAAPGSRAPSTASIQPTIAVIGAGRLGSAFSLALSRGEYNISALVSRRVAHAEQSARAFTPRPLALDATQLASIPDTDLVLITTPDDQIAEVASRFAQALASRANEGRRRRRVALHASGALASDALEALRPHNFAVGSLHPLVSVSDPIGGAKNLRRAFYCIEGDPPALRAARKLVRALDSRSFSIDARDKALYHAAAVIASGHTVALFDLATALLARCGLTPAHARQALLPLLDSTLDNLRGRTPEQALTGTFARADLSTVRKHLAALRQIDMRDALVIYALLGERSLQLTARRNLADKFVLAEIARVLATEIS